MKWHRIEAGLYEATAADGTRFSVERQLRSNYTPDTGERRARWMVFRDGEHVETAGTLTEAKAYCVEDPAP